MLVHITQQGGSVLDDLQCRGRNDEKTQTRRKAGRTELYGRLGERCYTAIAQKPSTGCIFQYSSVPSNTLITQNRLRGPALLRRSCASLTGLIPAALRSSGYQPVRADILAPVSDSSQESLHSHKSAAQLRRIGRYKVFINIPMKFKKL